MPINEQMRSIDAQLEELFARRMTLIEDAAREQLELPQAAVSEGSPYSRCLCEWLNAAAQQRYQELCGQMPTRYSGFGLLGQNLSDSCLPVLHGFYGEYEYRLFAEPPERLEEFFKRADFRGISVDRPYRSAVLPFLDELTQTAQKTQSVNVVLKNADGRLVGHNTDYDGFAELMRYEGVNFGTKSVLILGDGAIGRTAACYAVENGASSVDFVSRNGALDYEHAYQKRDTQIIINATPVGTAGDSDALPIDISAFMALETVVDLVYTPLRTRLYSEAEKLGVRAVGGLYMLVAQARRTAELFCGAPIEHARVTEVYARMARRLQNVVLIGMPGCGKSSIGKRLARLLGKRHLDTDKLVAERAGMSAEQYLQQHGEQAFAVLEAAVVEEVSRQNGCVISTGGETVLRGENVERLKRNGRVVWVDRAVSALESADRSLYTDPERVRELYAKRRPVYQNAADLAVKNRTNTQIAAKEIAKIITGRAF